MSVQFFPNYRKWGSFIFLFFWIRLLKFVSFWSSWSKFASMLDLLYWFIHFFPLVTGSGVLLLCIFLHLVSKSLYLWCFESKFVFMVDLVFCIVYTVLSFNYRKWGYFSFFLNWFLKVCLLLMLLIQICIYGCCCCVLVEFLTYCLATLFCSSFCWAKGLSETNYLPPQRWGVRFVHILLSGPHLWNLTGYVIVEFLTFCIFSKFWSRFSSIGDLSFTKGKEVRYWEKN